MMEAVTPFPLGNSRTIFHFLVEVRDRQTDKQTELASRPAVCGVCGADNTKSKKIAYSVYTVYQLRYFCGTKISLGTYIQHLFATEYWL